MNHKLKYLHNSKLKSNLSLLKSTKNVKRRDNIEIDKNNTDRKKRFQRILHKRKRRNSTSISKIDMEVDRKRREIVLMNTIMGRKGITIEMREAEVDKNIKKIRIEKTKSTKETTIGNLVLMIDSTTETMDDLVFIECYY